ncbi:MAG TPA: tetratricopeptide repeat protein [Burkholderiaceae bacterium]|nr:tetratricopeptide repeat protein [Burkholderiaceae bacterium]
MFLTRSSCVLVLAVASALSITAADERLSHEQALKALEGPVQAIRIAGIERLGEIGTMSDADQLVAQLADADDDLREQVTSAMWQIWSRSGDPEIDALDRHGVEQMKASQLSEAVATFSEVIRRKPAFAEGWNKRATVYFMMGKSDLSLKDCIEALKLNHNHFGALSGAAQIYVNLGRLERALEYYERALTVHPGLPGAAEAVRMLEQQIQERQRQMI